MDENNPSAWVVWLESFRGDHYEFHEGGICLIQDAVLFQCDEDAVVADLRFDAVKKYHGEVLNVPAFEWNIP